jgi:uncharacterized protein
VQSMHSELEPQLDRSGLQTAQGGSTLPFFLVALGITFGLQLPAALAKLGFVEGPVARFMPVAALGAFGPLIAALVCARFQAGGSALGSLWRSLCVWRVGAHWYAIALFGFTVLYVAGVALYAVAGGNATGIWLYPPEHAQHVAAMIAVPIAEEPGWRGYAQPRLQLRYGALRASLLLGVPWMLYHTMMFLVVGMPSAVFALGMPNVLVGSLVFSWIYNRTRGSLLLALVAHVGVHLNNPTHALPGTAVPLVILTAALAVFACATLVWDRAAWFGSQPWGGGGG